ncbi:MAG: hypothetical protein FD160_471 [Caulobacteraceae bacterium]|nr:MAG: hypothetical protein FD160_471 [Caulobacteraceae bacterium]
MKGRWILLIIAANLAALLGLIFVYPQHMISPGPLSAAHADLATECSSCHVPFRGATPERCTTCHAAADIGLRTTSGAPIARSNARPPFHQALTSQNCLSCHTEHLTASTRASGRVTFSHELLNVATREQCSSCHTPPSNALHRNMGANCSTCHSQESWRPATFDHDRFFALDGPHDVPCSSCHVNNDFSRYTCFSCHEHRPDQIRALHWEEGIRNFENCASCHRSASSGEGREDDD